MSGSGAQRGMLHGMDGTRADTRPMPSWLCRPTMVWFVVLTGNFISQTVPVRLMSPQAERFRALKKHWSGNVARTAVANPTELLVH